MQRVINQTFKAIQFTLLCSAPSLALLFALYAADQIIDFKIYRSIANVIMLILLGSLAFSIVVVPFLFFLTNNHRLIAKIAALLPVVALTVYAIQLLLMWPPNYI